MAEMFTKSSTRFLGLPRVSGKNKRLGENLSETFWYTNSAIHYLYFRFDMDKSLMINMHVFNFVTWNVVI
ncbi:hypothetical protein EB796_009509 [Bugula neritina]|uniref:Uncharacterized protein n=1 Tax=Bugula neritina TaxID=10212 RepID=A0A7J7K1Y7_BUGNE|nr:hypothetical protein EB796_009509 [Bugula neritina]